MPAGLPKVEVSFLVNADGILLVKAKELRSGVEQTIEVKPQYGLTDAEVEKMLLDSITNAKNDMQVRALVEAQTEAKQIMDSTIRFITVNHNFLTQDEIDDTNYVISLLDSVMKSGNKDEIHKIIEQLNAVSKPYAERLMDKAIGIALKGKTIID